MVVQMSKLLAASLTDLSPLFYSVAATTRLGANIDRQHNTQLYRVLLEWYFFYLVLL